MTALTLADFLRARLDEDEEVAQAAAEGAGAASWRVGQKADCGCCDHLETEAGALLAAPDDRYSGFMSRHDPARVIADVEAKRRIVHEHERYDDIQVRRQTRSLAGLTLRLLALPYAAHPDYRQEWKP